MKRVGRRSAKRKRNWDGGINGIEFRRASVEGWRNNSKEEKSRPREVALPRWGGEDGDGVGKVRGGDRGVGWKRGCVTRRRKILEGERSRDWGR